MSRRLLSAVLVLICLAVGVAWFLSRPATRSDVLVALDRAIADLQGPGVTLETAAERLATPEAAAAFVRDHVRETTYPGAVFAPEDVLRQRVGNRMDRARLLVALIEAQGGSARILTDGGTAAPARLAPPVDPDSYMALAALLKVAPDESMARFDVPLSAMLAEVDAAQALLADSLPLVESVSPPPEVPNLWVAGDGFALPLGPDPVPDGGTVVAPEQSFLGLRITGTSRDGRRHVLLDHTGPVPARIGLSFQPVVGPVDAFGKPPAPEAVSVWTPVLAIGEDIVSGQPFTPVGEQPPAQDGLPPLAPDAVDAIDAPVVRDLSLVSLDASNAPDIRATLTGTLPEGTGWQANWLSVSDGSTPVRPRLLSLPRTGATDRPVLLLIDASSSMAEGARIFHARDMAQAILAALPDDTPLTVAGLNGLVPDITRLPEPALGPNRAEAMEQVDMAFVLGNGYALSTSLTALLAQVGGATAPDIILIGDGALAEGDPAPLRRLLTDADAQLFTVAVDAPVDAFAGLGPAWRWDPATPAADLARTLLDQRGAQAVLAWHMPDTAIPGEERAVEIAALGNGPEVLAGRYTVPTQADGASDDRLVALTLELTLPDGTQRSRPLVALGPDASPWALEMAARITLAPGPAPDTALIAAALAEWRALAAAQDAAQAGEALPPQGDHRRFAALQRTATLWGLTAALTGEAPQLTAPMAILERFDPYPEGDVLRLRRTLDVLHDGGLARTPRAGLALAQAEAHLLGAQGVNARLLEARDRTVIRATDPLPDWAAPLLTDAPDGTALVATHENGAAWLLTPDGQLQARLLTPLAKGATDVQTAAQFKDLRSRLALISVVSGAAGSVAGVSGIAHGGLVGLLDQNLRLWCFSSVMMGYVADEIGGLPTPGAGDPAAWKARALSLCELSDPDGLARAYAANMASNMATGALGDALGALSGAMFTQGMAHRAGEIYRQLPRTLSPAESGGIAAGWGATLWFSDLSTALNDALVTALATE